MSPPGRAGRQIGRILLCGLSVLLLFAANSCRPGSSKRGGLPPGKSAPEIKAAGWLNGQPPEDLRGKVVVVEAWASWCGPCRKEAPHMVRMYRKYHPRGVVFIGLTSEGEDRLNDVRAFLQSQEISWPNGYGSRQTLEKFQVQFIPQVWVIGRDGVIVWNKDSEPEESMDEALDRALAAEYTPPNDDDTAPSKRDTSPKR